MLTKIVHSFIETFLRNISGGFGQKLRYLYYRFRFESCGKNVRIGIGVIFENPENIEVGNNVWFMQYSTIIAKPKNLQSNNKRIEKKISNQTFEEERTDFLKIGNEVQIGPYNIIHGFGGLVIKNKVTCSARVSIYSYSHYYRDDSNPSKITYANGMVKNAPISCVESPIVLEEGVWLGLGVSVFSGTVRKNSFISAHSVVNGDIDENSYAKGNPAKKIKDRFF